MNTILRTDQAFPERVRHSDREAFLSRLDLQALAPDVSIVVPAHDEQHSVVPLIEELRDVCRTMPRTEVIVVDDGSGDDTLAELRRARREILPTLRILVHERPAGQSAALLSGVRAARGRLVVTLDADGQNVPGDIPAMLALARERPHGKHYCIAGHRTERHDTRSKRLQSRVANGVRAAILRDGTPDTGCALKVIPRDTWLRLPAFDHMHRFLPALVRRLDGEVIVHPVRHRPRRHDRSKYGMLDRLGAGLVDLVGVLWLARRTRTTSVAELEP